MLTYVELLSHTAIFAASNGFTHVDLATVIASLTELGDTRLSKVLGIFGISKESAKFQRFMRLRDVPGESTVSKELTDAVEYFEEYLRDFNNLSINDGNCVSAFRFIAFLHRLKGSHEELFKYMGIRPERFFYEINQHNQTLLREKATMQSMADKDDMDEEMEAKQELLNSIEQSFKTLTLSDFLERNPRTIKPALPKTPTLDKFTRNLHQEAKDGLIDPVLGRNTEMLRISHILGRRKKSNPLLVGEAGAGKTAVVEGLAVRIEANDEGYEHIAHIRILVLDLLGLIGGTKYRGEFEERVSKVADELRALNKAVAGHEEYILFIDEVHMIVGLGSADGCSDMANHLKPLLTKNEVKIIGATTENEYKRLGKDPALARRFNSIEINPLDKDHVRQVLEKLAPIYEEFHKCHFTEGALEIILTRGAVALNRISPDAEIDLLDELGSRFKGEIIEAAQVTEVFNQIERSARGTPRIGFENA